MNKIDLLVVVACHDNILLLNNWLSRVNTLDIPPDTCILFINTFSETASFNEHFDNIMSSNKDNRLLFKKIDYVSYASGAYWWAYLQVKSKKYMFLHDSSCIIPDNLFHDMSLLLDNHDVVTFYDFDYDNYSWNQEWGEAGLDVSTRPLKGIFGPLFCVTRRTLNRIPRSWVVCAKQKDQEGAWERRWCIIFHIIGVDIVNVCGDFRRIWSGNYHLIRKEYMYRQ